jgi:hypothetical protein
MLWIGKRAQPLDQLIDQTGLKRLSRFSLFIEGSQRQMENDDKKA